MIYKIAVCDNNMARRAQLIEMLHVYSNEYGRNFEIIRYEKETELIQDLDNKFYHLIFLNILQAGTPGELDNAQDIHIKNPDTILLSLCPEEEYKYYRDIAKEFAFFKGTLRYLEIKNSLLKAIKEIDIRTDATKFHERYAKIQLKRKADYVEMDRITYIEKKKEFIGIHTLDRDFYCYTDFEELFDKINNKPNQFISAGDGCWINFKLLYGMEKIEGVEKRWKKQKTQYYAIMTGYTQVSIEEENYNSIFKRFVEEVVKKTHKAPLAFSC